MKSPHCYCDKSLVHYGDYVLRRSNSKSQPEPIPEKGCGYTLANKPVHKGGARWMPKPARGK